MSVREAVAALLILSGTAAATVGGLLVHVSLGLGVLGAILLALGLLLGRDVEAVVELDGDADELRVG